MPHITTSQGVWDLHRYPFRENDPLRAWDAADEYLLNEVATLTPKIETPRLVILNDSFAALSCCLHCFRPTMISDSFISRQALKQNLGGNQLPTDSVNFVDTLNYPEGIYNIVLIKIPKSLALLEDQLLRLRPHLTSDSTVLAAAMAKHLPSTAVALFEKIIGPTTASLMRKKARLLISSYDAGLETAQPEPACLNLDEFALKLVQHAGVFSMNKLDQGSRFFLEHRQKLPPAATIIDLGCGNGILGLVVAGMFPDAHLTFVDESYRAVASAKLNFETAYPGRDADFTVTDCLNGFKNDSANLIINNPPFHQQQTIGDHIAWQMFRQSRKVLSSGGQLWVVGNRHLGYHTKLKRLFGNCELVAGNSKFVVLRATKH